MENFLMHKTTLLITALFVLALMGAYSVYQPFLLSMTVAILLAMATLNLSQNLNKYTNSARITSVITTALMTMLLFVPIVYLTTIGVSYISQIDNDAIQASIAVIKGFIDEVPFFKSLSHQYLGTDQVSGYIQYASSYMTTFSKASIGFMKNMLFVVIFYFFINYYGNRFFDTILDLLPVSPVKGNRMIKEVSATMEVVFYSIIVTAIFEGFLFGIIMGYFGFNGLLFGVIYGFASLIPIVGGIVVWAPVSLYVWTKIDSQTAITIASYSIIVISIIADTFIKPMIIKVIKEDFLKSTIQIHSILIFFSILAGMSTYGFWGMILGPAITSFLIAITKVYLDYSEK